jgi:hypothetical protein
MTWCSVLVSIRISICFADCVDLCFYSRLNMTCERLVLTKSSSIRSGPLLVTLVIGWHSSHELCRHCSWYTYSACAECTLSERQPPPISPRRCKQPPSSSISPSPAAAVGGGKAQGKEPGPPGGSISLSGTAEGGHTPGKEADPPSCSISLSPSEAAGSGSASALGTGGVSVATRPCPVWVGRLWGHWGTSYKLFWRWSCR